jgi:hypothetical protein
VPWLSHQSSCYWRGLCGTTGLASVDQQQDDQRDLDELIEDAQRVEAEAVDDEIPAASYSRIVWKLFVSYKEKLSAWLNVVLFMRRCADR